MYSVTRPSLIQRISNLCCVDGMADKGGFLRDWDELVRPRRNGILMYSHVRETQAPGVYAAVDQMLGLAVEVGFG